jgi:hypothetical protein
VARADIDMTSYIPVTSGKAAFVLITINTSGTVVKTDGADVNVADLAVTDIPATPASTALVLGAIRVYNGQTLVQDARTNTDFVDLRLQNYDYITGAGLAAHLADTSDAHDASAISIADAGSYFTGTDVEAALQEAAIGRFVSYTSANDIFRCDNPGGASLWTGTISGAPAGAAVTVSAPVTGLEAVLVPTSTSQLAKMRLYNTTRSNYALISDYNTGTNVVTLTATAPANWANGDSLTTVSQTVSGGGGVNWIDLEVTDSTLLSRNAYHVTLAFNSATVAANNVWIHPFETFGAGKIVALNNLVASISQQYATPISINSNVISMQWSGTPIFIRLRILGYYT